MNESIFVTGGSGFIGRSLVKRLIADGYKVRALARCDSGAAILKSLGTEVVKGDISDFYSLAETVKGCDVIFHIAGLSSYQWRDRRELMLVNVEGTRNVIRVVEKCEIPKFIYCSSTAVVGGSDVDILDETSRRQHEYLSDYEETKTIAQNEVMRLAVQRQGVIVAMPSLVIGRGGDTLGIYIDMLLKRKLPFLVRLTNKVSLVYVEDLADGLLRCMTKGKSGEKYIFASANCSFDELGQLISKYSGVTAPRWTLSPKAAGPLIFLSEWLSPLHKLPLPLTVASLRTLRRKSWIYSGAKATKELEWHPKGLHEMVAATVGMN